MRQTSGLNFRSPFLAYPIMKVMWHAYRMSSLTIKHCRAVMGEGRFEAAS